MKMYKIITMMLLIAFSSCFYLSSESHILEMKLFMRLDTDIGHLGKHFRVTNKKHQFYIPSLSAHKVHVIFTLSTTVTPLNY